MKIIFYLCLILTLSTCCTNKAKREGFIGKLVSNVPDKIHLQLPGGCGLYLSGLEYQEYYVDSFKSDHSGSREIGHFYFKDTKKISIEYDLLNLRKDTTIIMLQKASNRLKAKLISENPNRDEASIKIEIKELNGKQIGLLKYDEKERLVIFLCGMYLITVCIEGAKDSEEADDIFTSIHIH